MRKILKPVYDLVMRFLYRHSGWPLPLLAIMLLCPQAHAAYAYRYTITVDASQAGATDSANFTILVNIASDANLKSLANGGKVQNTVSYNGQTVPADLGVFTDTTCSTAVTGWDEASYTATTGQLELWFGPVTLSHTTNGTYYLCFGDITKSTYQGGSVGAAWHSSFKCVWHLPDGSTLAVANSTSNSACASSNASMTAGAGQIDGAAVGDGTNGHQINTTANNPFTSSTFSSNGLTLSAWVKPVSVGVVMDQVISLEGAYVIDVTPANKFGFEIDGTGTDIVSSASVSNGSWTWITGTSDSSGNLKTYVNGTADTTGTQSFYDLDSLTRPYSLGGHPTVTGFNVNGTIDETRIANVARSADWITAEFNMQKDSQTMVTLGSLTPTTTLGPRGAQVAELAGPKLRGLH